MNLLNKIQILSKSNGKLKCYPEYLEKTPKFYKPNREPPIDWQNGDSGEVASETSCLPPHKKIYTTI